jgi:multidrug resistance efflux pump
MSTEWPKLRGDLRLSRRDRAGQAAFVVKDPVNGQFFRLAEADYFVASQLDGRTPAETIRQRVEDKFRVTLSPQALAAFVTSLRQSNLLEPDPSGPIRGERRGRWRGSLLYLRFKLFDPNALFGRLAGRLRGCFTPAFVALTAVMIIWAVTIALANWSVLRQDVRQLWNWDALLLLWMAACAVGTAHEFAHGLTCKHFGGEVRELGFLLMYFQPAFYCNVSDAWLFPEKRKRFWVGFAGPYFELFLWAGAVLVWRLTDPETWLNFAAMAVLATSGIKTLLNFNPLLKLDGYYLLSDLLDMPNLRRRAYVHLGDGIKRLLGFRTVETREVQPRERWIYLTYGLLSAALSIWVIGFVVVKLGGFLVDHRQPEALVFGTALLGMKVRRRFRRLFGKTPKESVPEDRPIPEIPRESNGAPEEPKPERRRKKRGRFGKRLVFTAVSLGVVLPILFFGRMDLRIAGVFVVLPLENADVRAEVAGTVEEVHVDEGTWVRPGEIIARLSDRDNRTALLKAGADLEQMKAQLRLLQTGPRQEEVELASLTVARAEARAKFAKKNLERDRQLSEDGLVASKDFETSKQAVVECENDVAEARKKLQLLQAGSRPEEIEAIKAGIARLETQHRYLEEQLAHVNVISPAAGVVTTPSTELREMTGRVVKEGDLIAKVHELKTVEAQIAVSEKDIAEIQVGQKVALKARAYPERTFFGAVTAVGATVQSPGAAQTGAESGGGGALASLMPGGGSGLARTILVTTRIANNDLLLKPGMTGLVKISCARRRVFDLLTRRLARTVKVEFWSWW